MKPQEALQFIMADVMDLSASIVELKEALYCERQDDATLEVYKDVRQGAKDLFKRVKKLCLEDFLSHDPGFFFFLGFIGCKRRVLKCFRAFKRSLYNSMRHYLRGRFDKADRWLGRSADYLDDGLKFLRKLNGRINTELSTEKSVQIQIQKGNEKM